MESLGCLKLSQLLTNVHVLHSNPKNTQDIVHIKCADFSLKSAYKKSNEFLEHKQSQILQSILGKIQQNYAAHIINKS